jgi:tetratricopeptide (TPR) repeat protein
LSRKLAAVKSNMFRMKNILLLFILSFILAAIFALTMPDKNRSRVIDSKRKNNISCGFDYQGDIAVDANGKFIIPLPGWGNYRYNISTYNDSAQFYFNQGLNMYYSYHMREATASFKEAARFDSHCPMAYWGEALSMGPSYNSAHNYVMPQNISKVLQLMNETTGDASIKEKDLMDAMNQRYSSDVSDKQRETLNTNYANRLKELISRYPNDQDIKVLYIDAMMLIHPWDFWNNDGSPKKWTIELVDLCADVLKTNPNHPAALHYYIHLTEASRHPEIALANAELLKNLFPGVAHMVHMSSHEYERNGFFAKGVEANDKADEALGLYDSIAKNINLSKHVSHYFAVQTYCAMSAGMYNTGMRDAMRCRKSVSPEYKNNYDQYLYMMPVLTCVRLGKWKEILRDNVEPDSQWIYAGVLYNFSRGLAYVNSDNIDSALINLYQLRKKLKDTILTVRRIPFNTPLQSAQIAEEILNAVILFSQKKYDTAIWSFENAIRIEDSFIYTEPKDWPIPARQFFGAYLLKLDRAARAEKIYREDLMLNPGNGWSLLGLCQSLKAQHKTKHLSEYNSAYLYSFSNADCFPLASVFMNK